MKRALISAATVIVVDQFTKWWALRRLADEPGAAIDLFWGARFQLHFNTGAAFSSGTGWGPVIGVVALAMTVLLFRLAHRRKDKFGQIVLGLIAGGAIGNLIDRIFRAEDGILSGAVIDFLRPVDFFAIFNIADAAIVVGVGAVLVQGLFFPHWEQRADSSADAEAANESASPSEAVALPDSALFGAKSLDARTDGASDAELDVTSAENADGSTPGV